MFSSPSNYFSPLSSGNKLQDPQWLAETMDSTEPEMDYVFSYAYISFRLKEALFGFCLAYLNCQRHYPCASGPLLSKLSST